MLEPIALPNLRGVRIGTCMSKMVYKEGFGMNVRMVGLGLRKTTYLLRLCASSRPPLHPSLPYQRHRLSARRQLCRAQLSSLRTAKRARCLEWTGE
jgi:hypothetical protein